MKPVTHIEEVKPEDIWFQEKDFNRIKKKIVYLVDEVSKGNDKGFCMRGLESLVGDQGAAKIERRYGLYDSVHEEQEYQKAIAAAQTAEALYRDRMREFKKKERTKDWRRRRDDYYYRN